MFNRYMSEDREAFEDLYRPVEEEIIEQAPEMQASSEPDEPSISVESKIKKETDEKSINVSKKITGSLPDFKRILKGLNIGEIGILPLLLLVFLILDVENDEKLLIIALAIVLGI